MVSCTGSHRSPIIVSPRPTEPTATVTNAPQTPSPTIPTSTPAPTRVIPSATPVALDPGVTPTNPLGSTFTPAPPTTTFTPGPTQLGIEIEYFITNAELIAPGDNVTLFWQVFGAESITVYTENEEGERENPRPLRDEGQVTLSTPSDAVEFVRFVLVAEVDGLEVEETLDIIINCDGEWFFAPSPGGCPTAVSEPATFVQQRFQNGLMIWSSLTNEIFIFYSDNRSPQWQLVSDSFRDGDPERDDSIIPPPELQQPIRGFGLVWRTTPGVRDRLGWAIESEGGFAGVIQTGTNSEGATVSYLRQRDGTILQLLPDGEDWQVIIPETTPEGE